jgi:phosphoribosylaminoimidazole-succinocarboxamide synthase
MEKREKMYEGKAKIIYATSDPKVIIHFFKDEATAFDGKKKGVIRGKGRVNATLSSLLFKYLEENGVKTHFIKKISENEIVTKKLKMFPLEVIVRNVAAGSLAKRMGYKEGKPLKQTVVEFYYKSDELGDPMLLPDHIFEAGLATPEELAEMREVALEVNEVLKPLFEKAHLILVDFKLEFGRDNGNILLGDEISPDTCRLWDKESGEKMDKDRFRRDLGNVEEAYEEVLRRLQKVLQ